MKTHNIEGNPHPFRLTVTRLPFDTDGFLASIEVENDGYWFSYVSRDFKLGDNWERMTEWILKELKALTPQSVRRG